MPEKIANPAGGGIDPGYLTLLQRYGGRRTRHLAAAIAASQVAAPLVEKVYKRLRRRDDFTITVAGEDDIYPELHEWVLARMPDGERKALIASTTGVDWNDDDEEEGPSVQLRYDGEREQEVSIEGHKIVVAVKREDMPKGARGAMMPDNWISLLERITFTARTAEGRDAVVRMIDGVLAAKRGEASPPALFMPSRWGGDWTKRGDLPPRTIESAILKDGQLEALIDDLAGFLAAEDRYTRLSQPWHRGYLFHGPPGTGKTSVARALAGYFDLPTYYLPLADIKEDTNLMQFVAAIEPRSVLLLEDVDAYKAATSRDKELDSVSIAAMLNALDGIWTPHGLITIMTTNNRDALDSALIRAGRVDVDEEFSALDLDQARRLADFFEEPGFDVAPFVGHAPSALIEGLRAAERPPRRRAHPWESGIGLGAADNYDLETNRI